MHFKKQGATTPWDHTSARPGSLFCAQELEAYRQPLLGYFTRQLACTCDAEDLVQEVFVRLLKRQADTPVQEPRAFLFQSAANTLKDYWRQQFRKKYHLHISDDETGPWLEDMRCAERIHSGRQSLDQFQARLANLPETTQTVFILRMYQRYPYQRIAHTLAISTRSAERHLARAMLYFTSIVKET